MMTEELNTLLFALMVLSKHWFGTHHGTFASGKHGRMTQRTHAVECTMINHIWLVCVLDVKLMMTEHIWYNQIFANEYAWTV